MKKKMQILTRMDVDQFVGKREKSSRAEFVSEFSKGYLWVEIDKQEQFIEGLTQELEAMKDRNSFKAQYLETWIESLKIDLEKDKKLIQ